ncbi:MAG: hypothetical protein ACRDWA_07775, partial [Acidimicrobiia bacterium]
MRRWRSAVSSLSIIFMLFAVGTAMAPTVEGAGLEPKYLELRASAASEPAELLPWPNCASPCPVPVADPVPTEPTSTTTTTVPPVATTSPPAYRAPAPRPAPG